MKPIVRIPLAMLVTAAAVSLGMVGVYAATGCVRFVQKKVHHHVSAETARRWAAWDKAHPNWHPRKRLPGETLAQLDFACAVPLDPKPVDDQLPPLEPILFDFAMDRLPPPSAPPVVAENELPPDLFPDTPPQNMVTPPLYSPSYPSLFGEFPAPPPPGHSVVPPVGMTPEPSTWALLATSMLAIGTLAARRRNLLAGAALSRPRA